MLHLAIERTRALDRQIAGRNSLECAAALLITAFFGWAALRAPSPLEQLGLAIVSLSGLWIIYYVRHHGRGPSPVDAGLDLSAYRKVLLENYSRQIRLLQTVQFWYLGPLYAGLLIANAGAALRLTREGRGVLGPVLTVTLVTLVFAAILLLNQRVGVGRLRSARKELVELTGGE
ncbi:hypothetical protein [Paludibaculum fermentans]|uniref:Uncharacterized protein n=1 Tax=Paludibaculum fermentans TaxID=1473598 RepID=A0A7S7NQM7_PALFE|nr:hypothetical protein [Paludibaculum fermentans]QOY88006.1 hypothetical protein IRI77_35605 [Paludibaculum fermentans]